MFFSPAFFKTNLHKKIYDSSSDFSVFILDSNGVDCLFPEDSPRDKPIFIGRRYFKLITWEDHEKPYLILLKKKNQIPNFKLEDGRVFLDEKEFPVLDLSGFEFHIPESGRRPMSVEHIEVDKTPPYPVNSKWWNENFLKYSSDDSSESDYETSLDLISKYGNLKDLVESSAQSFGFYIDTSFKKTDKFWDELRAYYQTEINKKLTPLDFSAKPPVFTRVFRSGIDLLALQKSMVQKIDEKINGLKENSANIKKQLHEVGDEMIKRGISLEDSGDYQSLAMEQKSISECIEKTYETLDMYTQMMKGFSEEAEKLLNKPIVDINGDPLLISKYYDQITNKLISLNEEINSIHTNHLAIEQELIKRLKDIEGVKDLRERLLQLEQERVMEEYRENKKQEEERRQKLQAYRDLGSLNESAFLIQKQIDEEKKKISQYMDNLKSLSVYENYESSVLEHHRNKNKYKEDIIKFRREAYKLKMFISRQEKKYDDFFKKVEDEVFILREEVSEAFRNNYSLEKKCISNWKERWEKEGLPMVENMFTRTSRIVEAFAPIPATQIIKICKLKEKLREEVNSRKSEWERVFSEIKREFEHMNYKLDTPMDSEVDKKYLNKLDDAVLTLSAANKNAIFISPERFQLSNFSDERIGLSPKTMDDDKFVVIDQVWEELTPEQEQELERKLKENYVNDASKNKEILIKKQLDSLRNRFTPQKTKLRANFETKSDDENFEKYEDIEEKELRLWKGDNYLIPNSRGEFRELLFEITKKLFNSKSVRMTKKKMEFTDTGFVKDGNTEIFSPRDYFIKANDRSQFSESSDDLDLSESNDIFKEPDKDMLDLISDPSYVSHAREREEKLSKLKSPPKPTITEWAQIFLKEYRQEKEQVYDVENLRGRLLEMEDEIKALKTYHDKKNDQLEQALADKDSSFDELKEEMKNTKDFLKSKDQELRAIMKSVNLEPHEKIENKKEALMKKKSKMNESRKGLFYWIGRLIYGPKDDDFSDSE